MIKKIVGLAIFLLTITVSSQKVEGSVKSDKIKNTEIVIKNGGVSLPGTLSYTQENQPLIIWIAGSGNVDRDGNQLPLIKADYIKQFREAINNEGVGLFSYDKRTVNLKNMQLLEKIIFDDFVADAKAVVDYFKNDSRFSKIVLIGHSQGSLVGMLASEKADKFISLAGPGESIDKVLIKQISRQTPMLETPTKLHCEELKKTGKIKQVNPMLYGLFNPKMQAFMANWMSYNPAKEISKLKIPVAIIQGGKDLQVDVVDAKLLYKKNLMASMYFVEDMNHLLKTIKSDEDAVKEKKDNANSYSTPDYPISKELINIVTSFVNKNEKDSKVIILGE